MEKQKEIGATIIPPINPNPRDCFFLIKLQIIINI